MEATPRKPYPSDLTNEQWELIDVLIPPAGRGGRPREADMREVVNAMLSSIRRRSKPANARLSVATTAARKSRGRKRHIAVDTLGLLLAIVVTAANVDDAAAAPQVLEQLKSAQQPRLAVVWADSKYHNYELYAWLARQRSIGWRLEIVRRPDGAQGFVLLPKRWVVERTFSWQGRWRRLGRDYEHLSSSSECMVRVASIGRMLRRLAPPQQQIPFTYRVAA